LLKANAKQYDKAVAKILNEAAKVLSDKKNYQAAVEYALSEPLQQILTDYPYKNFVTTYDKNLRVKAERQRAEFSAWYEFFPRSASPDPSRRGTLADAEALLPRIADLGFDVLYFPPIHPIGEVNRKGKNNSVTAAEDEPGSPWAIGSQYGGHKSVAPELGTLQQYEALIQKANALGIEIALDLALQCAPDHPYIKSNPEWFTWRPDGTIAYAENPPKKYQDIVPINFECDDWQNLWVELKSIFIFWIERGVTIFRVDNPHTKPLPFWQWCIAEIQAEYPDVIFLSEAFTRPKIMAGLAKAGFTQGYTYYTWRVTKAELTEYMTQLTQTESREYFRPNFWPNTPDILPYHLHNANQNAFFLRLAMAATLTSSFGVYGPVYEFGYNQSFNGREEYHDSEKYEAQHHDWTHQNRITALMKRLNQIRKENPALQSTWNISFAETSNEQLFSYLKIAPQPPEGGLPNIVWTVANLDPNNTQAGMVAVPEILRNIDGTVNLWVTDLLTNERYHWTGSSNYVELNPFKSPLHIFQVQIA
jgi:starch synthase (maltosyl-transferring)